MAVDNAIAIAALVISLVALLTTLLQLLQQYFATADGYRRCQNSVMAGWAKFTRRHFRWKEFRYETIFVVPDITFREELRPGLTGVINQDWQLNNADARMDFGVVRTKKIRQKEHDMFLEKWKSQRSWPRRLFTSIPSASALLMGSEKSEKVDPDGEHATTVTSKGQLWMVDASQQRDLACWVKLMHEINKMYDHMLWKENGIDVSIYPVFGGRQQSWDFIAPDVSRPYIAMSICDLVILARLLGMRWTIFNLAKGELRAEGADCFMNSRLILSVGCVMDFQVTGSTRDVRAQPKAKEVGFSVFDIESTPWFERLYVPDSRCYRMMFGIIPTSSQFTSFGTSGLRVGTQNDWDRTISTLIGPRDGFSIEYLAADLLPLIAPMLRKRNSRILYLPRPFTCPLPSWLSLGRVYRQFRKRLAEHKEIAVCQTILDDYLSLRNDGDGKLWDGYVTYRLSHLRQEVVDVKSLDLIAAKFEVTETRLSGLQFPGSDANLMIFYQQLAISHLVMLTRANDLHRRIRQRGQERHRGERRAAGGKYDAAIERTDKSSEHSKESRGNYEADVTTPAGKMDFMFQHLDELCDDVSSALTNLHVEPPDRPLIKDAWVLMVFRGMCWTRCHVIEEEEEPVPSQYWRSKQEIYIG